MPPPDIPERFDEKKGPPQGARQTFIESQSKEHADAGQSETIEASPPRIDDLLGAMAKDHLAQADRHAKELLEFMLWIKGLLDLQDGLLKLGTARGAKKEFGKLHLKLMLKIAIETLPFRKLEVWISEDRLLQTETGIRTDKQRLPLKDLEDWQMITRNRDERGHWFLLQMDMRQWTAPVDDECARPVQNRKARVRRKWQQLGFGVLRQELKEKITQLRFEAFADAAARSLETPDGKPIPCDGGIENTSAPAFTLHGGMPPARPLAGVTLHGGIDASGNPVAHEYLDFHSPVTGESVPPIKREYKRDLSDAHLNAIKERKGNVVEILESIAFPRDWADYGQRQWVPWSEEYPGDVWAVLALYVESRDTLKIVNGLRWMAKKMFSRISSRPRPRERFKPQPGTVAKPAAIDSPAPDEPGPMPGTPEYNNFLATLGKG